MTKALKEFFRRNGRKGGKATAAKFTPEQRSENARRAVNARWKELCRDCDGCGWTEGGATLQTTCKACAGTGLVRKEKTAGKAGTGRT